MKQVLILSAIGALLTVGSCRKEGAPDDWKGLVLPPHFGPPAHGVSAHVTKAGFELGRKLFNDPILSRDNSIACASCHIQASAFTQHGHDLSHGIDDQLGRRNSLPVQNLLWQTSFFWDGGVHNIDMIPVNAITNPVEMDETLPNVLEKLRRHREYPALFEQVWGSKDVNTARFLGALSQFMVMLISADSRYDHYRLGTGTLTESELRGLSVFERKCASCHAGEQFSDFSFRNNGLLDSFESDKGRYEISLRPEDVGKFRVPSLRNVARTQPYMHTGTIPTLRGAIEHYRSGVKLSATLDPLLVKPDGSPGISLTEAEIDDLLAFLHTLTDEAFIRNPLFEPH